MIDDSQLLWVLFGIRSIDQNVAGLNGCLHSCVYTMGLIFGFAGKIKIIITNVTKWKGGLSATINATIPDVSLLKLYQRDR